MRAFLAKCYNNIFPLVKQTFPCRHSIMPALHSTINLNNNLCKSVAQTFIYNPSVLLCCSLVNLQFLQNASRDGGFQRLSSFIDKTLHHMLNPILCKRPRAETGAETLKNERPDRIEPNSTMLNFKNSQVYCIFCANIDNENE